MSYKGKVYRLLDGKSYLCIYDSHDLLVFAQVYYTDPSHAIMEVNLDTVKIINKDYINEMEYLEELQKVHMKLKFTKETTA